MFQLRIFNRFYRGLKSSGSYVCNYHIKHKSKIKLYSFIFFKKNAFTLTPRLQLPNITLIIKFFTMTKNVRKTAKIELIKL